MARKQVVRIELRKPSDACFEGFPVSSREIGPTQTLVKNDVPREEGLFLGPVNAKGPWGMAGSVEDLEGHALQLELSFLEEQWRLKVRDPHGAAVMGDQAFDKVQLDYVQGDQGW